MNLLYPLTTYPPCIGGAQLHQHLMAQQMGGNHTVQVVTFWDRNRTDWLLGTTIKVHSQTKNYTFEDIPVHRLGFNWREKLQMLPWLPLYYPLMSVALPPIAQATAAHLTPFAKTADLIHNVRIGREGLTYASWQVARQHDIPFILTPVHHPRWVGWRYREYNQLYRQADAVIALTPAEKKLLVQLGVSEERIHITGIGPILAPTSNPEALRQRHRLVGPVVLFLGQLYQYKGYRKLLAAAPKVWQRIPEAQFVFVGPAVKNSESFFEAFQDPRIHRLGALSLQEKTDALAACDLLCVPSNQESFGGVYTEAWSFGKPVIGCNIPAVADVISDGVDGFLVEQEASAIADRIIALLTNPAQAQAMGQAGKAKVEDRYNWLKLAQKTEQIYHAVCRGQ